MPLTNMEVEKAITINQANNENIEVSAELELEKEDSSNTIEENY